MDKVPVSDMSSSDRLWSAIWCVTKLPESQGGLPLPGCNSALRSAWNPEIPLDALPTRAPLWNGMKCSGNRIYLTSYIWMQFSAQGERAIRDLHNRTFDHGNGSQRAISVSKARPRRVSGPGMGGPGYQNPAPYMGQSPGGYQVSHPLPGPGFRSTACHTTFCRQMHLRQDEHDQDTWQDHAQYEYMTSPASFVNLD